MKQLAFACVLIALTGCTSIKTKDFTVTSFLNKKTVKNLSYTVQDADNVKRTLKLDGYQSEQVEAFTEGVKAAAALRP